MSSKMVCGVMVDDKKCNEIINKSYYIGGLCCDFGYVESGVAVLNGKERAKGFTEDITFCKNCKIVYDRIRAELISYNRAKGLDEKGKSINSVEKAEEKAMRHEKFGGYLEDLKSLFLQASQEREALKAKLDKAVGTWEREKVETRNSEYDHTRAQMDYLEAQKAYKESVLALEKKYKESVKQVQAEFESHLDDFYAPNGNRIDTATVSLLNSGIKLKGRELDELLVQFSNNPTMLRILGDYSVKNGLNKESRADAYNQTAKGYGSEERRIFNRVADFVNSTVGLDEKRFWAWNDKGRNSSVEAIDGAITEMDNYFIRPAVGE